MSHSLIDANRTTHLKIVSVSILAVGVIIAVVAVAARAEDGGANGSEPASRAKCVPCVAKNKLRSY